MRLDDRTFEIFHAFDGEAGLQAHLSGSIAAALLARAEQIHRNFDTLKCWQICSQAKTPKG